MTPGGGEGKGSTEKGGEEIKERGTKAFRLPSLGLVPSVHRGLRSVFAASTHEDPVTLLMPNLPAAPLCLAQGHRAT